MTLRHDQLREAQFAARHVRLPLDAEDRPGNTVDLDLVPRRVGLSSTGDHTRPLAVLLRLYIAGKKID